MRKHLLVLLLIISLEICIGTGFAEAQPIKVFLNGAELKLSISPIVREEQVLAPMKELCEGLGAKVDWIPDTKTAIAVKGSNSVEICIGSSEAKVNGSSIIMSPPASVIDGKAMVPLQLVSEAFGAKFTWDKNKGIVTLSAHTIENINLFPGEANLTYPMSIAVNPKTERIYAAMGGDGSLAVIDSKTGKIITGIKLGFENYSRYGNIMVDPSTDTIYVGTLSDGIAVIDGKSNTVRKTLDVKGAFVYDQVRGLIYAVDESRSCKVSVVDPEKNLVIAEIPLEKEGFYSCIALNSNTGKVYISHYFDDSVSVVDIRNHKLEKSLPTLTCPQKIIVDENRNKVYVNCRIAGILCFDGDTGKELKKLNTQYSDIIDIDYNADDDIMYALCLNGLVSVDCGSGKTIDELKVRFDLGGDNVNILYDESSHWLYLTTPKKDVVEKFAVSEGKFSKIDIIYLGSRPIAAAINPDTQKLYAADYGSDAVIVADTVTKKVLKRIPIEGDPFSIGINPGRNEVYVAAGDGIYFIDTKSDTLQDKLKLGGKPKKIAVNEAKGRIYVTDYLPNDGCIYMIDAASRRVIKKADASFPQAIAVNGTTGKLYSAQLGGGKVSPIITGMEILPDGNRITISGWSEVGQGLGGKMCVFSDGSLKEAKMFFLPDYHYQAPMAVDERRNVVYAALSTNTEQIIAIDGSNDMITQQFHVSDSLHLKLIRYSKNGIFRDMAVNPKAERLYLTVQNNKVIVFDSGSLSLISIVELDPGSNPEGLAIDQATGILYSANSGNGTISEIDIHE